MGDGNNKSFKTRHLIILIFVVATLFFTGGILIGRLAMCPDNEVSGEAVPRASDKFIQDAEPDISNILIQSISTKNIEDNLRYLSSKPHIAGEARDFELVQYLKEKFNEYGMDSTMISPYEVLLSYPDRQRPNSAKIISLTDNSVIYDSLQGESRMSEESGVVRPFVAYSPSGSVQGELVYVNYGRVEDYVYLENNTDVNVTGKIVIARYGKAFRGTKVVIAAKRGAIGILFYSDPKDHTWPEEDTRVFPDTWWIPPDAVQRGTTYTRSGDPLTPGYPATRTAFRYNMTENQSSMPPIPAHAISYKAAEQFLRLLKGEEVPNDWKGGLNIPYKFGPTDRWTVAVNLTTSTTNVLRKAENVISIIKGEVEPDRYVLFGNHRDAWIYGSIDPSSGTAAMMEVARAMGKLVKKGKWRPRRSIMFCSWGAEEYGIIGSMEFTEQYIKSLGPRAVAYINIDTAVEGNYSLRVLGAPLLYRPTYEATKKVSNPNKTELTAGIPTVYDKWLKAFPWKGYNLPMVNVLGSGSDFAPFIQILGVTSVDLSYTYDQNKYKIGSYPLYHTEYETFDAVKTLLDKDFEYHQAIARVGAELLRSLADSLILPFNVSDYVWYLDRSRQTLHKEKGILLSQKVANYNELEKAITSFQKDASAFEKAVASVNKQNPMATRMVNDQMHLLEKAFLDPAGLPGDSARKHLLMGKSSSNAYAGSTFPGLVNLLFEIDKLQSPELEKRWQRVNHHFSVIVNAIQAAGYTLRDVTKFIEEQY